MNTNNLNRYQQGSVRSLAERGAGISGETLITRDNHDILLTQDTLIKISNIVSKLLGNRLLARPEIEKLKNFIGAIDPKIIIGLKLGYVDGCNFIAKNFIRTLNEPKDITPDIHEYEKSEINQFTPNESQYKFSAFAEARGNAVIDAQRMNVRSYDIRATSEADAKKKIYEQMYKTGCILEDFFQPDNIQKMFTRIHSNYINYDNITLPKQIISLDSKNRLSYDSNNEYKWQLYNAGDLGRIGNIRIQNNLQQIIRIHSFKFWIPTASIDNSSLDGLYYNKFRMLIKEFQSQSINVTEYFGSIPTNPETEYYHFEYDAIENTTKGRIELDPINDNYDFKLPFAEVSTISISFRTPFQQLLFAPDNGIFTMTYGNPTILSSTTTYGLPNNSLIYVLNSNSGSTTIDNILTNKNGYFITTINPTSFSIPIDTSTLIGDQTVSLYFGSRRMIIQLEFTSLEQ